MPQPFSRIVPNPHLVLTPNALADKPDMAILVTQIFAVWATIEQELKMMLVRILGAAESPAIAIFSILTAQHLQLKALEAAAKASLGANDYQVFQAMMMAIDSAQTPRNHLAHWRWTICEKRPDLLGLADPDMIRERDVRAAKHNLSTPAPNPPDANYFANLLQIYELNPERVLAYSKADLERALRDLNEVAEAFLLFEFYLDPEFNSTPLKILKNRYPQMTPDFVRADILRRLNEKRLFREALARIRADQQSTRQQTDVSPQPESGD